MLDHRRPALTNRANQLMCIRESEPSAKKSARELQIKSDCHVEIINEFVSDFCFSLADNGSVDWCTCVRRTSLAEV
jgi:hypothetical protein